MVGSTWIAAIALIVLGLGGYFLSGMASPTALIPAVVGVVFAGLAYLAQAKPDAHKHVMHGVSVLALLGVLAGLGRGVPAFLGGEAPALAIVSTLGLAGICLILLILCIRSFISARKARQAEQNPPGE